MSLTSTVAERIRAEMYDQGVSGRELARRIGVGQKYLQRRLCGRVEFRPSDLEKIAAALNVTPAEFLGRAA